MWSGLEFRARCFRISLNIPFEVWDGVGKALRRVLEYRMQNVEIS
jgi:hypothetical protein